jgi:hypothetical protein
MKGQHYAREVPEILDAATWLRRYLDRFGPAKVATVEKYAVLQGFTASELYRAAAMLPIEVVPGGPGETARYWRLR